MTTDFETARDRVHAATRRYMELRASPSTPYSTLAAALAAETEAANAALHLLHQDRRAAESKRVGMATSERLGRPFEEAIEKAVTLLRESGPLTGSEIEARRIRGLSKNTFRGVLREAQARELVRSFRDGKRVLWAATPDGQAA